MKQEEKDRLKKIHRGDFKTLFEIYQSDRKFYKSWFFFCPLILSIITVTAAEFTKSNIFTIVNDHLYGIIFSVIPCLLGFNLGAFILIVGFGSTDVLKRISKPLSKQKNFSLYQKLISVLGASVFIQVTTLATGFIFQSISILNIPDYLNSSNIINPLALFFLMLLIFYSISQLFVVVKHVFLFGQTIHFNIQYDLSVNAPKEKENVK